MTTDYSEAVALRDTGRYAEAESKLRAWLETHPVDLEALAMLAQMQLLQGQGAAAKDTQAAMADIDATAAPTQRTLARLLAAQKRYPEAVLAARKAYDNGSDQPSNALVLASTLISSGDLEGATAVARELLQANPELADAHLLLAQSAAKVGRYKAAVAACETALKLKPGMPMWAFLGSLKLSTGDPRGAAEAYRRALELNPSDLRGLVGAAEANRSFGRLDEAEALARRALAIAPQSYDVLNQLAHILIDADRKAEAKDSLEAVLNVNPAASWAHIELAWLRWNDDPEAALAHLRTAVDLAPGDPEAAIALARGLAALRSGDEGARLDEAAALILSILPRLPVHAWPPAVSILWRTGHYEAANAIASFAEFGRYCAVNSPSALLHQMPKVGSEEDRLELLDQHRLWGRRLEQVAGEGPIVRRSASRHTARIRLGLLSSDLRNHVVAHFAHPLFAHPDPRFELYCYSSFPGERDEAQAWIERHAMAYRKLPGGDRAAAQVVADDQLDLLVDLGGPTLHNRPGVVAHRPAVLQASWLGYPHSLGVDTIDYFIADPYLAPDRAGLLLERPLIMPNCWICMGPAAFPDEPAPASLAPVERTGRITFGTANNTYKFNPRLLRTWARVLAAVPGSRFMIVRPEVGAASLRGNVIRHFEEEGVTGDRVDFRAIRGGVKPIYGEIDIALDTFPLTGGTTTCEALWMGVPTVSLWGEAVFERLSWSILSNAGLGDLVAQDVDEFVRIAVEVAGAPDRIADLRRTLRDRIRARPLGQPERFASDFYDLMARAVAEGGR